jgi:hypothetical protein
MINYASRIFTEENLKLKDSTRYLMAVPSVALLKGPSPIRKRIL